MKLNDKVKIWVDQDDSQYASKCYGVEAQNDWFDIQYYPEQIEAIVIWNKGVLLAQQVYKGNLGIEMRGRVFNISKDGIKERIENIKFKLKQYDLTIADFWDDEEKDSLECFFEVIKM